MELLRRSGLQGMHILLSHDEIIFKTGWSFSFSIPCMSVIIAVVIIAKKIMIVHHANVNFSNSLGLINLRCLNCLRVVVEIE